MQALIGSIKTRSYSLPPPSPFPVVAMANPNAWSGQYGAVDDAEQPHVGNDGCFSVRLVREILKIAEAHGCDTVELLRRCGCTPREVEHDDARIAVSAYARLQRHAMLAMDDESLGAMPGRQHLGTWAMICRSVIGCNRLGHALNRMFRHYALFDWSLISNMYIEGDDCVIDVTSPPGVRYEYGLRAYEMVFTVTHYFASWLIQESIPLRSVSFVHDAPEYVDDYRVLFNCDSILFGQARAQLRFPSRILECELRQDERSLEPFLADSSAEMVETVLQSRSWAQRLRARIERNLVSMPEFHEVARQLGFHPQTLRRRLALEGTTYKELKDEVRRSAALYYVQRPGMSLEDVAYRIGFSEASAFIRAFRRWTGTTPTEYKLKHAA